MKSTVTSVHGLFSTMASLFTMPNGTADQRIECDCEGFGDDDEAYCAATFTVDR